MNIDWFDHTNASNAFRKRIGAHETLLGGVIHWEGSHDEHKRQHMLVFTAPDCATWPLSAEAEFYGSADLDEVFDVAARMTDVA